MTGVVIIDVVLGLWVSFHFQSSFHCTVSWTLTVPCEADLADTVQVTLVNPRLPGTEAKEAVMLLSVWSAAALKQHYLRFLLNSARGNL